MKEKKRISLDAPEDQYFYWKMMAVKENISLKDYIIRYLPKIEDLDSDLKNLNND